MFRVSLIGHRVIENYDKVEEQLSQEIVKLIGEKEFVEFLIGRNGEFDIFAASCIKRAQKHYGKENSEINLVLPYRVADMDYYEEYYDNVIIPEELTNIHFKAAISKRNQWMVDNSDLLIAYVYKEGGGAYKTVKYARKTGKDIINIALQNSLI